jgi:cysteine synthase A
VERYDGAFQGSEQEGVAMAHHLLRHDGLFVGGSSALNCVGAVKLARKLGPGHTIGTHSPSLKLAFFTFLTSCVVCACAVVCVVCAVTVLCDSGQRYNSRIYNTTWLEERGLSVPHGDDLSFLEEDGTPSQ